MAFHTNNPGRRKRGNRQIMADLKRHVELMNKFVEEGMTREQASAKAYEQILEERGLSRGRCDSRSAGTPAALPPKSN